MSLPYKWLDLKHLHLKLSILYLNKSFSFYNHKDLDGSFDKQFKLVLTYDYVTEQNIFFLFWVAKVRFFDSISFYNCKAYMCVCYNCYSRQHTFTLSFLVRTSYVSFGLYAIFLEHVKLKKRITSNLEKFLSFTM